MRYASFLFSLLPLSTRIQPCCSTSFSVRSPHRQCSNLSHSLYLISILSHTHFGLQPLYLGLKLHLSCVMFFGAACAKPLPPCLAQYLQPVGFRSLSSSFVPSLLLVRCLLLLRPFAGGEGEREVDGNGVDFRVVFLSDSRRPLLRPLLWPPSSLSVVAYALSVSELSEERLGCR